MTPDSDRIQRLSAAISESQKIDWDEELSGLNSEEHDLVLKLALIDGFAKYNRKAMQDDEGLPFATWGHLRLESRIGEGSYGEVFRAWDDTLEREVALKLFHSNPEDDANSLRRNLLLEEARNLAKVEHDNVVRVHGADIHNGRVGFWMELLIGQTLEDYVHECDLLPAPVAAEIGMKICQGLSAIHNVGLIHRDIKASNILRDVNGRICILDFGSGSSDQSEPQRVGTPLYMAPEVIMQGQSSKQSDIYSFGVLLFYMLTGQFPIVATDTPSLIAAHENQRTSPVEIPATIPRAFRRILERSLSPNPAARFEDAMDIAASLRLAVAPRFSKYGRFVNYFLFLAILLIAVYAFFRKPPELQAPEATISIATLSGAEIYLDGQQIGLGTTTQAISANQNHTIKIIASGYADSTFYFIADENDSLRFEVPQLRALTGGLQIRTIPFGAQISVGGQSLGPAPLTLHDLRIVDPHVVQATMEGFHPVSKELTLHADSLLETTIALSPITFTLIVVSDPKDASIAVDGHAHGPSPATIRKLRRGEHEIDATLEGHIAVDTNITLLEDLTLTLRLSPEPPGTLILWGDLPATIYIDDQRIVEDVMNSGRRNVPAGQHHIIALLTDGSKVEEQIAVHSGEVVIYNYSLKQVVSRTRDSSP